MNVRLYLAVSAVLLSRIAVAGSTVPAANAKSDDVEIWARLITEKDDVVKAVGSDLKRQYVIVELTVKPRGGYPVTLNRDDFLLRSARDNERATADSPDRIAGPAVLVLGATGGSRPVYSESGDPVYVGGFPGIGSGRPRRVGSQEDSFGGGGDASQATVTSSAGKESPLLSALKQKELPLGETRKPVSGYLYFPVDPKQKVKNFYLHYKGPAGTCELRFK